MILEAEQKQNLHMAWIDLRKAYDSVPHDWILHCSNKFGVHPKIVEFLEKAMACWSTILTANGELLGKVSIKRGIFLGDSLSPSLFIMCLAPLSRIIEDTQKAIYPSLLF